MSLTSSTTSGTVVNSWSAPSMRTAVIAEDRASHEIAALAGYRPPEPLPWWLYADVDPDLGFADWRNSMLCAASLGDG